MILKDTLESLKDFWKEFYKVKVGLIGLALLLGFVIFAIFGTALIPFPEAPTHWRDINYWQDNPQSAPPVWTNWFASKKGVESSVMSKPLITEQVTESGGMLRSYAFTYNYHDDKPPKDVVVRFSGTGFVPVTITAERPDGLVAVLYASQMELTGDDLHRVSVGRNCAQSVIEFVRGQDEYLSSSMNSGLVKPVQILFSKLDETLLDIPEPLKGNYKFTITAGLQSKAEKIGSPSIIISGNVSGILGTDAMKRDVYSGLVIGIRWALLIGILTSLITVSVGVLFGVIAAFFGGWIDWVISRFYEVIYLMPVLPFLIVVSAIFKPSIWTIIFVICIFFWAGAYKPVYGMALQIKEETFVEASRALGSGKWRIIFKHIVPILLPYSFAVMALSIPGVIVYEASLSLLGLGDATIVTWGQLLFDALSQGAVINNLWWWVVPPGLMIALMGMSFAFLGTALDKILHPKLKTR